MAFGGLARRHGWTRLGKLVRLDHGRGPGTDFERIFSVQCLNSPFSEDPWRSWSGKISFPEVEPPPVAAADAPPGWPSEEATEFAIIPWMSAWDTIARIAFDTECRLFWMGCDYESPGACVFSRETTEFLNAIIQDHCQQDIFGLPVAPRVARVRLRGDVETYRTCVAALLQAGVPKAAALQWLCLLHFVHHREATCTAVSQIIASNIDASRAPASPSRNNARARRGDQGSLGARRGAAVIFRRKRPRPPQPRGPVGFDPFSVRRAGASRLLSAELPRCEVHLGYKFAFRGRPARSEGGGRAARVATH